MAKKKIAETSAKIEQPKPTGYRLLKMSARDFKRISLVEFNAEGNVITVCGNNGQGKSSVIDAVWAALGGASDMPDVPVRKGQKEANIELQLGELDLVQVIVRLRQTAPKIDDKGEVTDPGKRYLELMRPDGAKFSAAQSHIDELLGKLMFDPLAFVRMKSSEQAATLARVAGVDVKAYATKRQQLYEIRAEANRVNKAASSDVVAKQGILDAALKAAGLTQAPDKIVSVADEVAKSNEAMKKNNEIKAKEDSLKRLETDIQTMQYEIDDDQKAIEEAESKLKKMKEDLASNSNVLANNKIRLRTDKAAFAKLKPIPTDTFDTNIRNAEKVNATVRAKADYHQALIKHGEKVKTAEKADQDITDLDANFNTQIENSPLPIKEVTFNLEEVFYKGVPFDQAAESECIKVSVEIAAADNCKLRIMKIEDALLLDSESKKIIYDIAERRNVQVLLEVVGNQPGEQGQTIEICDGRNI